MSRKGLITFYSILYHHNLWAYLHDKVVLSSEALIISILTLTLLSIIHGPHYLTQRGWQAITRNDLLSPGLNLLFLSSVSYIPEHSSHFQWSFHMLFLVFFKVHCHFESHCLTNFLPPNFNGYSLTDQALKPKLTIER